MPHNRLHAVAVALFAAALALLCSLSVRAAEPAAAVAPRIGVATMLPGEIFFERFGHDAIVVIDPASGEATSYNFGYFDPSEDDFISRFVRGDMMYYLVALPLQQDLSRTQTVSASVNGSKTETLDLGGSGSKKGI